MLTRMGIGVNTVRGEHILPPAPTIMPHPNKTKGTRIERALVKKYLDADIPCTRVVMSGALGGELSGDLRVGTEKWHGEVKSRKGGGGFVTIKRWLGDNDILILHENYEEPLVVMPWSRHRELMQVFEREVAPKDPEAHDHGE